MPPLIPDEFDKWERVHSDLEGRLERTLEVEKGVTDPWVWIFTMSGLDEVRIAVSDELKGGGPSLQIQRDVLDSMSMDQLVELIFFHHLFG